MRLLMPLECVEDVDITIVSVQSWSAERQFSTLQIGIRGPHGFTQGFNTRTVSVIQLNGNYVSRIAVDERSLRSYKTMA